MTSLADTAPRISMERRFAVCLLILLALTAVRLIGLVYSDVDLFFDESQYWAWSRELAFGYFSKPPLLAWIIAGASAVCGDGEACVRAASPILYFGTLHYRLFPPHVLVPTAVDTAIPFVPVFVIPYLSFFLLVPLPLLLISDRRELRDAAFGYGLIVVSSSLTFLFWPTAIPYSDVHLLTRVVVAVDLDGNAFPSLHASLGIYCALWAWRKLQTDPGLKFIVVALAFYGLATFEGPMMAMRRPVGMVIVTSSRARTPASPAP